MFVEIKGDFHCEISETGDCTKECPYYDQNTGECLYGS